MIGGWWCAIALYVLAAWAVFRISVMAEDTGPSLLGAVLWPLVAVMLALDDLGDALNAITAKWRHHADS